MRTQAIILKKIPIREYDELIICYTKDSGKQIYQAKSILRSSSKQANHLDILNYVDFSLVDGNGHPIITSAYCIESFTGLKSSLEAMSAGYFLLECFDRLVFEGESDYKLWNFLIAQLGNYNREADLIQPKIVDLGRHWTSLIANSRQELLQTLGYDHSQQIEALANSQFRSLQFARKVLQ
jgi:DNA repair protein RecO